MSLLSDLATAKVWPALAGLVGAVITLSLAPVPPPRRRWFAAMLTGVFGAYYLAPIAAAGVRHAWPLDWMPADGSLEGLMGLVIGILGIYAVEALRTLGARFAKDPARFLSRKGAE